MDGDDKMRALGLSNRKLSIYELLQACRHENLRHAEIYICDIDEKNMLEDARLIADIRETVGAYGLTLSVHAIMGTNFGEKLKRLRCESVKIAAEETEFAEKIGAKWIVFHAGSCGFANKDVEKKRIRMNYTVEALEMLDRLTANRTANIAIENLPYTEPFTSGCRIGDSVDDFQYMFNSIGTNANIGYVLDIGHLNILRNEADRWYQFIREHPDNICAYHVHWNDGIRDSHVGIDGIDEANLHAVSMLLKCSAAPIIIECKRQIDAHNTLNFLCEAIL